MTLTIGLTDLPLERLRRGKVRDVYVVDAERLLLVASDRVSAFDVVMHECVPYKGVVLTQVTAWWLRQLQDGMDHDGHQRRQRVRPVGPQVAHQPPHQHGVVGFADHILVVGGHPTPPPRARLRAAASGTSPRRPR